MQLIGHTRSHATLIAALAALALCVSTAGSYGSTPSALTARTITFSETGRLHASATGGSTINEEGHATGTYNCSIVVHLVIVSAERVNATFTVRPPGGSVSGSGSARFSAEGANGYVGGVLTISKGTGAFAHASGRDIGFSGKFNRETFSATVHVHGAVHL